jgi:putative PIG3 family NAD(P)H quinone oxidoreductase
VTTMKAISAPEPGGPDALRLLEVDRPEPGPGEVLIAVHTAGVNRADVYQRMGLYPPPPGVTDVLGLECAGEVVACGAGVSNVALGDRVCALLPGGGYAEYAVADAGTVAVLPGGLDMVQGAGLMEAAVTVWSNVFWVGGLTEGDTLLVHGGASGIGTMAIQLAKAAGARVVVTAGSQAKLDTCRDLGADLALNYRDGDFADALDRLDVRADIVLDIMGGSYLGPNVRSLATGGRLVVIGMQGGTSGELDLAGLMARRGTVTATSLRARSRAEKAHLVTHTVAHVWPLLERGVVAPVIHAGIPLADAARAHRVVEESRHVGKVVLTVR